MFSFVPLFIKFFIYLLITSIPLHIFACIFIYFISSFYIITFCHLFTNTFSWVYCLTLDVWSWTRCLSCLCLSFFKVEVTQFICLVNVSWIWKMAYIWGLSEIVTSYWSGHHHLPAFCFLSYYLVYRLSIIIVGCMSVWPLEVSSSINSKQVKALGLTIWPCQLLR